MPLHVAWPHPAPGRDKSGPYALGIASLAFRTQFANKHPRAPLHFAPVLLVKFLLGKPEGLFFRMNLAFCLGFGDAFEKLSDEWPWLEVKFSHEFLWADKLRGQDAFAFTDVACE